VYGDNVWVHRHGTQQQCVWRHSFLATRYAQREMGVRWRRPRAQATVTGPSDEVHRRLAASSDQARIRASPARAAVILGQKNGCTGGSWVHPVCTTNVTKRKSTVVQYQHTKTPSQHACAQQMREDFLHGEQTREVHLHARTHASCAS